MKKRILLYTLLHLSATAFCQDTYKDPYAIFGHKSNTKYETIVDEMLYVKNGDTTSPIKAMAFNVENNVVLIFGKNDSLIDKKDIQPEQVLRFISSDPLSAQYPELTPYQFASNRPIQATDIDGLEAYFNNSGEFIKWGRDKSQTAPVIFVSGSTSIQLEHV
ncbi:hypothetical protein [Chitinophaga sp. LS1]|uniref:hypothetical protein n=1 Tax=Chitinophaga sp. LS1 TaxID=3051176 RepID=UPI002AABDE15|nr:hypothetical protein [Chitinophaga sp. LS1]WPV65394.1 hypothetical protein QQL36_26690 [Chitinophaga sp. LS1]